MGRLRTLPGGPPAIATRDRYDGKEDSLKGLLARTCVLVVLSLPVLGAIGAGSAAADAPAAQPLPNAACNQGTEKAFWDIGASPGVPMYMGFCMTMPGLLQP